MSAQTAAQVAELHPELSVGTAVTVYPEWSRGQSERPYGRPGVVARHVRNGYVRVREDPHGTHCDFDPRDVVPR